VSGNHTVRCGSYVPSVVLLDAPVYLNIFLAARLQPECK
jgi:hypothetical protein